MARKIIAVIFPFLFFPVLVFPVDGPVDPASPKGPTFNENRKEIVVKKKTADKEKLFTVRLSWYTNREISGRASFQTGSVFIYYEKGKTSFRKEIALRSIRSIVTRKWEGKKERDNEYFFYPTWYTLITKDNAIYDIHKNISLFNMVTLKNENGSTTVYSYFVDYWKDGTWQNCKSAVKGYPELNPPEEVFVKLEFR